MTQLTREEIVERIRIALTTQRFADWYTSGGRFDQWITSEEDCPDVTDINDDIRVLFKI